jgi:hypothetical protein
MVAIKLNAFGGTIPTTDDRLLPDNMAASASNAWLHSGLLEGYRSPKLLHTCVLSAVKRVYRIPQNYVDQDHLVDSYWLEFLEKDVDVIHSPTANDSFERYYWAGQGIAPQYNTLARIAAGSAPFILGVPAPTVAPGVTHTGGSSTTVSRAYVYTWVTAYGEEGPPSPPTVYSTHITATWNITLTAPTGADTTDRNLTKVRIYRTITSSAGVATYFLVTEQDITDTTYSDTQLDSAISGNGQLESTTWTAPPTDMKGMVSMANGMVIGFRDNEILYAEPYRPHAWPVMYSLSVDFEIVGIGVIGQTAIICTEAATYAATGINPSSVTLSKISTRDACLSRGGIVSTPDGVYYPTSRGLALAAAGQVVNVTEKLFSKDNWLDQFNVPNLRSARLGSAYYTFGSIAIGAFQEDAFQTTAFELNDYTGATTGGVIDGTDARLAFMPLSSSYPTMNLYNDPWTNEVLVLRDNKVYWIDVAGDAAREEYVWRSKRFQPTIKKNLEAMKVYFDNPEGLASFGTIKIYADGRLAATKTLLASGQLIRLPSGFKAEFWQIEITSRVSISSVQMATSVKELASV